MRLPSTRRAFSIIELMISLIIMSVLVTMVILVASQRAAEARLRAAEADLRMIVGAEQTAVIDTGYFLRLYVLDDITGTGDDDPALPPGADDVLDALEDEAGNTRNLEGDVYAIVPDLGTLQRGNVTNGPGSLVDRTTLFSNESAIGIGLPYITYPQQYVDASTGYNYNVPMDPWGNPYLIFTRLGMIIDVSTLFTGTAVGGVNALVDPVTVGGSSHDASVFDRLTILSFGPNAAPGDGGGTDIGTDDDIYLQLN